MENNAFISGYGTWPGGEAPGVPPYPYSAHPPVSYPGYPVPAAPAPKAKKGGEKGPFTLRATISSKNQLQEYAQHLGVPFPFYATRPTDDNTGWMSVVNFNGTEYTDGNAAMGKKQAESRAAEECLRALGLIASPDKPVPPKPQDIHHPIPTVAATPPAATPPAPATKPTSKADLHHFLTSHKMMPAIYATKEADEGKGFVSTVEASGEQYSSTRTHPNKKSAENEAAEVAFTDLKQKETEELQKRSVGEESFVLTIIVSDPKFKISLNEYCMRRQIPAPVYQSEMVLVPTCKGFKATCEVVGQVFQSEEGKLYANKKSAEQAAAASAWETLRKEVESRDAAEKSIQSVPYKAILQEHLGRRDLEHPTYTFERLEGQGFVSECQFEGKTFRTTTPYLSKKTAESEAAKLALEGLGFVNLNKIVERRILKAKRLLGTGFSWRNALIKFFETKGKKLPEIIVEQKNDGRYHAHVSIEEAGKFASDACGFQEEESAVSSAAKAACIALSIPLHVPLPATTPNPVGRADGPARPPIDVVMDDASGQEVFVPTPSLKRCLEEFAENYRMVKKARSDEAWAVPNHLIKSLVVVEIWPDKKNVAIVGNQWFSCPLLCLNAERKCEIEVDGAGVALEPGMVLEDLEAVFKYIPFCGGISLLANKCARTSKATASTPPVVTGAGVVLITREEEVLKVLLKRYKVSTAFIPAVQEMSFAFRRAGDVMDFGRNKGRKKVFRVDASSPVNVERAVKNIQLWTNEEVEAVRTMTGESMSALFSLTKWKWLERWNGILEGKTKTELRQFLENVRKERLAAGKPAEEKEDEDPGDENGDGTEEDADPIVAKPAEAKTEADGEKAAETNGKEATTKEGEEEVKEEEEDGVPLRTKFGFDDMAKLAEAEFQRRKNAADGPAEDLTLRPWSFPRGGFRHQALSTGVHLESTAECARRELKEECGVTLKLPAVEEAVKAIVLRTDADNLNPHKGDANAYYFHEVEPDVAKAAGKPIQEVMDISRFNKVKPFAKRKWLPFFKQHQLLRQKEPKYLVHEEFAWFPVEEAALLAPVFNYIMTTEDFRKFAKLPALVKEELIKAEPLPSSPARATGARGGRRGRR